MTNDNVQYYTDDISLWPSRAIWRWLQRNARWGRRLPLFIYFMSRKIGGSRNPVYGLARPETLIEVDRNSLPVEAQGACEATATVCRETGYRLVTYVRSQTIGSRRGYAALWLHSQGLMYATTIWFEIRRAGKIGSRTVFSCHSVRTNDQVLHGVSIAPKDWIPELVPPKYSILNI